MVLLRKDLEIVSLTKEDLRMVLKMIKSDYYSHLTRAILPYTSGLGRVKNAFLKMSKQGPWDKISRYVTNNLELLSHTRRNLSPKWRTLGVANVTSAGFPVQCWWKGAISEAPILEKPTQSGRK